MPPSRCAPSWTKRNIPKASRFPISRWLTSTSPATRSMATGTIRFHLTEKIIVQNELTELFMDEPLVPFVLAIRYGVVAREEAYLERKFGDVYRGYRSRVRRWL